MSLVVFPFKSEDPSLVLHNIGVALDHPAIDTVWAVGAEESRIFEEVAREATAVHANRVSVFLQSRIGSMRPGKGDAMNTAIARAAGQGRERTHFYDADITNFSASWIDGAEKAADHGFGVVRHRFPRAATDAMITWFVTRPGLALSFPGTILPRIDQPLGGELLLTLPALERLAYSDLVTGRSDWGIDTTITYATALSGLGLYEHHVADGKRHALYGSLEELRTMLVECLDAVRSLRGLPGPPPEGRHQTDRPAPVPTDLKGTVAYDLETTTRLLMTPWAPGERALAGRLTERASSALSAEGGPGIEAMDEDTWRRTMRLLLDEFRLGDPAWESLAFRLWVTRVLAYTTTVVPSGYDTALSYLESTIRHYEETADQS